VNLEGIDGVAVVNGDEDDQRNFFRWKIPEYLEATHVGHPDIEKDQL